MHRARVLVVEKDRDHADTLLMLLESFGCVALWAPNADAAMGVIFAHRPDVLVIEDDVPMAGAIIRSVREENRLGALVVCVTSWEHDVPGRGGQCDVRLVKPYEFERIWHAVRDFVGTREEEKRRSNGH
jgi:DNA-binding response OmpR family regulator